MFFCLIEAVVEAACSTSGRSSVVVVVVEVLWEVRFCGSHRRGRGSNYHEPAAFEPNRRHDTEHEFGNARRQLNTIHIIIFTHVSGFRK